MKNFAFFRYCESRVRTRCACSHSVPRPFGAMGIDVSAVVCNVSQRVRQIQARISKHKQIRIDKLAWPTRPYTHTFVHSHTHNPHSLARSLTHSLTHSLTPSLIHSLTHSSITPHTHSLVRSLVTHSRTSPKLSGFVLYRFSTLVGKRGVSAGSDFQIIGRPSFASTFALRPS